MTNININIDTDNNIMQELEKVDEFNEKIEREMNNILKESDCVIVKAESQINGIINNDAFKKIEKDIENSYDSSFALSIDVSRDLFKEFDNEHNISAIYPTSVDIPLTNLPDDGMTEEPKYSQELAANKLNELNEEKDATDKNNESLGSSLEITITNNDGDETNNLETTLLKNSPTFKGCSKEFAASGVKEKITVIVDVEKGKSISGPLKENIKPEVTSNILQEKQLNEAVEQEPKNSKTDINSKCESTSQKISLKRPNNENYPTEEVKKLKIDETKSHTEPEFDCTQTEYTQVIFDADETADANDPKWSEYNNNFTSIDEHFESVRKQWRSMALPNPHKNLTTRFVPEHLKYEPETSAIPDNEYACMSCVEYLDNKINRYTQKVNSLYVRLNCLPQSNRGRSQRNKLLREIDELQKFVIEIVKNREEIQQNYMFYKHPNNTWNANYLTRTELDEMKEQEKLLELQKRFYSR